METGRGPMHRSVCEEGQLQSLPQMVCSFCVSGGLVGGEGGKR